MLNSRHSQLHPRGEDRERIIRARKAAEALFTSKQSANPPSTREPAAEGRKPRVLQIISPTLADRNDEPEAPPVVSEPPAREVPRAEFARIRIWVKYGMTAAQVAQVYGVAVADIKRILRKTWSRFGKPSYRLSHLAKNSVHLADQAHELARFDLVMPHVAADNARDLFNNAAGCRTSSDQLRAS